MAPGRKEPRFCAVTGSWSEAECACSPETGGTQRCSFMNTPLVPRVRTKTPSAPTVHRGGRRKMSGCAKRNAEQGAGRGPVTTHKFRQRGRHSIVPVCVCVCRGACEP